MTDDTFSHFRAAHPECGLLMLSDTRCGTVLAADGALAYPQEYLDAISTSASDVLTNAAPWAIFLGPHVARLFLSAPHLGNAALTCLAHPDADLDGLMTDLQELAKTLKPVAVAA